MLIPKRDETIFEHVRHYDGRLSITSIIGHTEFSVFNENEGI